jgi:cysteine desulfurase
MSIAPAIAYFDWNATAPLTAAAREAMAKAMDLAGNPSSVHAPGRAARAVIDQAREKILGSLGRPRANLVFTSGGTEANALALSGPIHAAAQKGERITRIIVTAIEHDCVLATAKHLESSVAGVRLTVVAPNADGRIDPQAIGAALMEGKGRALVALMLANNETGVIQPVAECVAVAKSYGALIHCDAAQAWGRIPIDMGALGVDTLALSAHKAGGPKGAGALIVREGLTVAPQMLGGGQEFGLRAGTQNVPAIAGFGAAAELRLGDWEKLGARRDALERELMAAAPHAVVYGQNVARLPNTICIGFRGLPAETQVIALDMDGVAVSAGAACSSGKVRASHVLSAMGVSPEAAGAAIRISFGPSTSDEGFARLRKSWGALARRALADSGRPAA